MPETSGVGSRTSGERSASALSRRDFLKSSAVGGALAVAGPLGCESAPEPTAPAVEAGGGDFALEETTIAALREGMASGEWTARSIAAADLIVARFGEKYRQWNAAFDAGLAVASGVPLVTLHGEDLDHALKEVDAAAQAVCRTPAEVVKILEYTLRGCAASD